MAYYEFFNQYNTPLHKGYHPTVEEAWSAFFEEHKYPLDARDVEEQKRLGIYFTKTA